MKTQVTMGSHLLTFTVAANHFTLELSSITDFFPDLTKKNVCAFRTYARHVCSVRPTTQQRKRPGIHESSIEFDSHVGTIVFGRNFLLLCHNGKECSVAPYNDAYDSINNVPIVSAATAWTSNSSGETYILEFNEGLWMGDTMNHTLINPNQCRAFGLRIQDDPSIGFPLYLATENHNFHETVP